MKAVRLFVVLAIALGLFAFGSTNATAAGTFAYQSSIQIQNLENAEASISLRFYNQDGTEAITPVSDTIPALGKKDYFQTTMPVSGGFNGSVVVTSTTNVASISNVHGGVGTNAFWASGAYIAQNQGTQSVGIPLLMLNNSGYSTWFNVQNADATAANVTVTYSDGLVKTATIQPGAAKTFFQNEETHAGKIFAAKVEADKDIVVTVVEESAEVLMAYNGFGSGTEATNPLFPLVHEQNSGYTTNLAIQNRGASDTVVTVSYTPNGANGTACTETQTVPAGGTRDFAQFPFNGVAKAGITTTCVSQKFIGSAKVTANSAGMPLVGVANQWKGAINGSAYDGYSPSAVTSKIIFPLIFDRRGSALYKTTINLMNVGTTTTTVTCTYTNSSYTDTAELAGGTGVVFFQENKIAANYLGAATCTASGGGQIVAIVNEYNNSGTDDTLLTYEGINVTP